MVIAKRARDRRSEAAVLIAERDYGVPQPRALTRQDAARDADTRCRRYLAACRLRRHSYRIDPNTGASACSEAIIRGRTPSELNVVTCCRGRYRYR